MAALLSAAMIASIAASCPAARGVPAARIFATPIVESGRDTLAIKDDTTGRSYSPQTVLEAVARASDLIEAGHSIDAGVMQVNSANWKRLGLNVVRVFDPRANICAGLEVLAEAYRIERRVSCRYNTGQPDCSNGYPEKIAAAEARVGTQPILQNASASLPNETILPDVGGWNVAAAARRERERREQRGSAALLTFSTP